MTLVRLDTPDAASAWCAEVRARGKSIGLVPTMGSLHAGHRSLVERAARENDRVCVSVFVNPLQFGEAQDFDRYPRDFGKDCELLAQAGADMAFTGTLAGFFPGQLNGAGNLAPKVWEDPGPFAAGLEGEFRPGHFEGVATIVKRLFEVAHPTRAYFGAKDYQQTLVVEDLARRMGCPEIVVCPILREPSGLAMSSRNALLTEGERAAGLFLSRALFAARGAYREGERDIGTLARLMRGVLGLGELVIEYAAIRDPKDWTPGEPTGDLDQAVALIAARAGAVRLIDNMELHVSRAKDKPSGNHGGPKPFGAGL